MFLFWLKPLFATLGAGLLLGGFVYFTVLVISSYNPVRIAASILGAVLGSLMFVLAMPISL